ncbi:MAG: hypothetical protein K8H74_13720 [Notoacmeibacter sp.]|nr:hypothetical protein [Notoacmeibacter sp.]
MNAYNACYRALGRPPTPGELIHDFASRDHEHAGSTIRGRRLGLRLYLDSAFRDGTLNKIQYVGLSQVLEGGPAPRPRNAPKRGAAKKRKAVRDEWIEKLLGHLAASTAPDDLFLHDWIVFTLQFFPRPSEWPTAKVALFWFDRPPMWCIRFVNGKHSNGRAHGDHRYLALARELHDREPLARFVDEVARRVWAAGSFERFRDRLAARLARVCRQLRIPRLSLYAFRHKGMARAKYQMSAVEVAYAAGHATDRTATTHYARRRTGAGGPDPVFSVPESQLQKIRITGKATFDVSPRPALGTSAPDMRP